MLKDFVPPALWRKLGRMRRDRIRFEGPYSSWSEAESCSEGYDSALILERILGATLSVKFGRAQYERDSVLFDHIEYSWPVISGLMWAAARDGGRLRVLDFGGSLGTSYFQSLQFLEGLSEVRWAVVEQAHFASVGREQIADARLWFFDDLQIALGATCPNVVLLSSVLQYLPAPLDTIAMLAEAGATLIAIDRTCYARPGVGAQVMLQRVPPRIYPASYPIWLLDEQELKRLLLARGYGLAAEYATNDQPDARLQWKGHLFKAVG